MLQMNLRYNIKICFRIVCVAIMAAMGGGTVCRAQINTDQVMNIGRNALYFEDYILSIQYFNQVIKAKPYLADPYFYRAIAKLELEDYKGAEEDYKTAEGRGVLHRLYGDSVAGLVTALYDGKAIGEEDLRELRAFLDGLEGK